jgi:hypothetical protein
MLRDAPLVHFDDVLREARNTICRSQSISAACGGGGFNLSPRVRHCWVAQLVAGSVGMLEPITSVDPAQARHAAVGLRPRSKGAHTHLGALAVSSDVCLGPLGCRRLHARTTAGARMHAPTGINIQNRHTQNQSHTHTYTREHIHYHVGTCGVYVYTQCIDAAMYVRNASS